jgi:hypothetical protein
VVTYTIRLSEDYSATLQWSADTRAVQDPTGVMLYSVEWDYRWFRDAALTSGTLEQAHTIFGSQLKNYSVV